MRRSETSLQKDLWISKTTLGVDPNFTVDFSKSEFGRHQLQVMCQIRHFHFVMKLTNDRNYNVSLMQYQL